MKTCVIAPLIMYLVFILQSSLLQLLLKELPAATGNMSVFGNMSYASQQAWLYPSTVRENILFGTTYEADKYKRVSIQNLQHAFIIFKLLDYFNTLANIEII